MMDLYNYFIQPSSWVSGCMLPPNTQLLVLEAYYQKRFRWTNTEYGKIDWWIFTPVYRRAQNKHRKLANKFVWQSFLLINKYTHVNQSMMQGVAHVGLTAKQMIIYYDVPNKSGIELRSINSSND